MHHHPPLNHPGKGTTHVGASGAIPLAGIFPCSLMQEGLFVAEQMTPGTAMYNIPESWHLEGPLDVSALKAACASLIRRHETLRTRIVEREGRPMQEVFAPEFANGFELEVVNVSGQEEGLSQIARRMALEATTPFGLHRGPLARFKLFRLGPDKHTLFINLHHIISDAWSQNALISDLVELYRAAVERTEPALPELPIQYADFAVWHNDMWKHAPAQHLEYWREKLRGPLPACRLPADLRPGTAPPAGGNTEFIVWQKDLLNRLKQLSRAHDATLFTVLLTGFKILLTRYLRQQYIVVGAPFANRERIETERLIGFFVNTQALRTELANSLTFGGALAKVRQTVLEAGTHQGQPLEQLLQALNPGRPQGGHPLFNIVFGLQGSGLAEFSVRSLRFTKQELHSGSAKFDWSLLATETPDGLSLRSEYSTERFRPGTMQRMVKQLQTLMEGVLADANSPISRLPMMSEAERTTLLLDWNNTRTTYERHVGIHEVFEAQVRRAPHAIALVFGEESLTYAALNRRANQLARRLLQAGAQADKPIAICLDRSMEMVVSVLAILKAGGGYLPLDPTHPRERQVSMLHDTQCKLVIGTGAISETVQEAGAKLITPQESSGGAEEENPECLTGPESLAYIIFTSGSTGGPKAVAVPHRAVVRLVRNTNYIEVSPADAFLQLAPLAFDASTFEIWGALLNGARLVVAPPGALSLAELGRLIRDHNISILWLTAGLFNEMVDHELDKCKGLKFLLAGGDALSVPHVQRAGEVLSPCQLINGYGPTENTTFTCCYRVPRGKLDSASVPIGKPISNSRVFVLDQQLEPVPVGVPGEIYISGDGLARGYANCPELTREKFVSSPFPDLEPGPMYRSGDLGRWLPDGSIEFLGRLDEQVKIRGFRVEPGEVETVLAKQPDVLQAVVIARENRFGAKELVAYVVGQTGRACTSSRLVEFLAARLPAWMVPAHIVMLEHLPLTPNGKVDRRALPAPILNAKAESARPETPTEKQLVRIWSDVLGVPEIPATQNFFSLGGHSLLAMQVVARISKVFGVELPLRQIFEFPTARALAQVVEAALRAPKSSAPRIIKRRASHEDLINQVAALSDDEVDRLLQETQPSPASK